MTRDAYAEDMAIIALGSNLPWRDLKPSAILAAASNKLGEIGDLEASSGWWRADAWPNPKDPAFINFCVRLRSSMEPTALLARLLEIELELGRTRKRSNAPRTLDLDLIAVGGLVCDLPASGGRPRLELPHPRMHERAFVLLPLADIAPDWRHPKLGATVSDLADRLTLKERAAVRRTPVGEDVI